MDRFNFQKGFIVPLVIAMVVVLVAGGVYIAVNKNTEVVKSSRLQITSIKPSYGPVGTIVTLNGKGFVSGNESTSVEITESSNKAWNPISVSTTSLVFRIPADLPNGIHSIRFFTSERYTPTSNSVDFTVTSSTQITSQPSITVLSPNEGESYAIGNKMSIRYSTVFAPSGSYLSLSLVGGPTPIDIRTISMLQNANVIDYVIPTSGCREDYCYDLKPGNYKLKAILYDKQPCGAMAICSGPSAKILAETITGSFTITN